MEVSLSKKRQREKEKAAEKRRKLAEPNKENENTNGLSSVAAIKISTEDEKRRIENRRKTQEIISWVASVNSATGLFQRTVPEEWNQPFDWRYVTQKTLHKYIPFEKPQVNISFALQYVKEHLDPYGPPHHTLKQSDADTPIWYMSNNRLRQALYSAAINRKILITSTST